MHPSQERERVVRRDGRRRARDHRAHSGLRLHDAERERHDHRLERIHEVAAVLMLGVVERGCRDAVAPKAIEVLLE